MKRHNSGGALVSPEERLQGLSLGGYHFSLARCVNSFGSITALEMSYLWSEADDLCGRVLIPGRTLESVVSPDYMGRD